MEQYFKVEIGSEIDKKIKEFFNLREILYNYTLELKDRIGIESEDLALNFDLELIFKPTDNDFKKFKNKLCDEGRRYFGFKRNTKIYKEIGKDKEEKNIKNLFYRYMRI